MAITSNRGFTIFFAMLVSGLALAIGVAIYDLTVRELDLAGTTLQSQYAIYAADTGAECALYWDFKCTAGGMCQAGSAFATSSNTIGVVFPPPDNSEFRCNEIDITASGNRSITSNTNAATTTFRVTFLPQLYYADVTVAKRGTPTVTTITASGYNTGATGGLIRLERKLQVNY